MIKKSLTQNFDQFTETEQALYATYKEDLKEIYNLILIETSSHFLHILFKRANISLSKQFNDIPQESISKIEALIRNQIYPLEYKTAYTAMTVIKRKQEAQKALNPYSGDYIPHHCSNKDANLYHTCGRTLYFYRCRNDSLMLCIYCDMAYKSDLIKAHCLLCKEDFCTKILLGLDEEKAQFATWKKYHCNLIFGEKMKCLTCANDLLYTNNKKGYIHCDKCKYDIDSRGLMYKCIKCNKTFSSEAKAYNPYEQRFINIIIKDALIKRYKARPDNLPCNCSSCGCDIDIKKTKFRHYYNNKCNGEMINGEINKKKIVICTKCESVYYHEDYKWKCQSCSCSSNTKGVPLPTSIPISIRLSIPISLAINRSYGKEKSKEEEVQEQELAPTDYCHSIKNSFNDNHTPIKNSDSNKDVFIPVSLRKRNSNCQLMKKMPSNNNIPNYSALKCNLAKKFSCYNVSNFDERININLDKSHNRIKTSSLNSDSTTCSFQHIEQQNDDSLIEKLNIENYKIIKQIGEGSFGKIFLVESKAKQRFALKKIIASNEKELVGLKHEYDMLLLLQKASNVPALIHIYGIQSNKLDPTTYIMYVLMELGTIDWEKEIENRSKKKQYYTELELIKISYSLVKTLGQIQRKNISHRDIKPQNILLCSDPKAQYKIADFGEAKESGILNQRVELQTLRGTELYMSPILFQALRSKNKTAAADKYIKYNAYKSDVFSLGLCILYAAVLSYNPIYDIRELTDMISVKMVLNKYLKKNYSDKMIDMMMLMLEIDEEFRCDFIQLERRFEQLYAKILDF